MTTTTWRGLWAEAEARLGSRTEARRIVERASGWEGSDLVLNLERAVPDRALPFARAMVERRAAGEPLQYVVGRWGFRRLDLLVDRRALIPRPETETVVEVALGELRRLGLDRPPLVADLGTGTGAIALSVALEVPSARVWATDVSADALDLARANLAGLGSRAAPRVSLAHGDWFGALPGELRGRFDLVVSNPPYVGTGERLPAEVAGWEPHEALYSGATGMEALSALVAGAPTWLARPAALVVEIAPHQQGPAVALARAGGFEDVAVRPDMAGLARTLVGRLGPQ